VCNKYNCSITAFVDVILSNVYQCMDMNEIKIKINNFIFFSVRQVGTDIFNTHQSYESCMLITNPSFGFFLGGGGMVVVVSGD
jgi:hypothetical protein